MTKRLLLLAAFLVGTMGLTNAQALKVQKAQKANEAQIEQAGAESTSPNTVKKVAVGEQLLLTDYDYAGNNTIPQMIDLYEGLVFGTAMFRSSTVTAREVHFFVGSKAEGFAVSKLHSTGSHGWGTVQVAKEGPLAGQGLIMTHSGGNSWLFNVSMEDFSVTERSAHVIAGNFPGFAYLPDGTVFVTNANGVLYKSTDDFATAPTQVGVLDPERATAWPSEYYVKTSPNGQYLMHFGAWTVKGNGPFEGFVQDSADFVGINYSNDQGATWEFEEIAYDGITEVANRPGYTLIIENFGQVNGVVDNNGVRHIAANGYSYYVNGEDTTFAFPAVYWNSRDRQWLAISDQNVETTLYADDSYARPGNGFGSAYPVPAVSPDGNKVVIAWQGPEYAATPGGTPNIYNGTVAIHYTDLYYVTSGDGGKSFSAPEILVGEQNTQESYPYIVMSEGEGTTNTLHFVYMVDAIPGTSLFADNNEASDESAWYYDEMEVDIVVGVEDEATVVNSFELEQNYPNPFNPSTTIKYNLPEAGMVTLKVYDVLGKEVATIVNQVQNQGSHEVSFNASNLASGLYIYKISAGNFVSSKKMMLMK